MLRTTVAAWLLLGVAPAAADADSILVALNLGSVLGSEKSCDLKFNQTAIENYIAESVRAGETGFAEALSIRTQHVANDLKKMTPAQKASYCALVNRLARANRLVLD